MPSLWFTSFCCAGRPLGAVLMRPTRMAADFQTTPQKRKIRVSIRRSATDNDMVAAATGFRSSQAVKSLSALVVPVGSLQDTIDHQGLAHFGTS